MCAKVRGRVVRCERCQSKPHPKGCGLHRGDHSVTHDTSESSDPIRIRDLSPRIRQGMIRHLRWSERGNYHLNLRALLRMAAVFAWAIFMPFLFRMLIQTHPHVDDIIIGMLTVVVWIVAAALCIRIVMLRMITSDAEDLDLFLTLPWPNYRAPVCYACNYDLHGLTSATCPECGEKVPWLEKGTADEGDNPDRSNSE